jgi:sugar O-acyltransferase (sialic acid O-acetyltransferase NeuD family)
MDDGELFMARVILFGISEMSEMMHFYLTHDSAHQVVAFTVDEAFLAQETFCNLPVLPFETIEKTFPPTEYEMGILLGYKNVNQFRATKYAQAKSKGYKLINYISSKAITWPGAYVGENSFIFEQSVIMPFSKIGIDVFVSIGCLVGHHSTISDHAFLSAHVVVLGKCMVGENCIIGANSTIKDSVAVGDSCVIGVGSEIVRNTRPGQVYIGKPPTLLGKSSDQLKQWVTWSTDRTFKR